MRHADLSRPTVNDVARAAGVSLATVDRVLNLRPGVREKTITRVNAAIKEIGYVRDVAAANLARKRNYRFAFVISDGNSQFLEALRETIEEIGKTALIERMHVEQIQVPDGDPHLLVRVLSELQNDQVDGVAIMAAETPHVRDAIRRLKRDGIAVVSLISDLPNTTRDHFVGINNVAAGETAGVLMGRFLRDLSGAVLVLASSMQLRESVERRLGFDSVMVDRFPEIEVLPSIEWRDDSTKIAQSIATVFAARPDIIGVYSLGSGNRLLSDAISTFQPNNELTVVAHELTSHTRAALRDGTIDVVITQNVGHVVRSALRVLRANSDGTGIITSQERIRIDVVLKENLI